MPNSDQRTPPNSIATWVKALFEELNDPEVLEVALTPGVRAAIVECRGASGSIRLRTIPAPLVAGVVAKMKKLANLDVAERRRKQRGQVRLLDFHGGPAIFEVMTGPADKSESVTLRRL
jgi:type II secretory ATPase GspE/PulE/Tfp pilus assembly ATPase PilB-like protein